MGNCISLCKGDRPSIKPVRQEQGEALRMQPSRTATTARATQDPVLAARPPRRTASTGSEAPVPARPRATLHAQAQHVQRAAEFHTGTAMGSLHRDVGVLEGTVMKDVRGAVERLEGTVFRDVIGPIGRIDQGATVMGDVYGPIGMNEGTVMGNAFAGVGENRGTVMGTIFTLVDAARDELVALHASDGAADLSHSLARAQSAAVERVSDETLLDRYSRAFSAAMEELFAAAQVMSSDMFQPKSPAIVEALRYGNDQNIEPISKALIGALLIAGGSMKENQARKHMMKVVQVLQTSERRRRIIDAALLQTRTSRAPEFEREEAGSSTHTAHGAPANLKGLGGLPARSDGLLAAAKGFLTRANLRPADHYLLQSPMGRKALADVKAIVKSIVDLEAEALWALANEEPEAVAAWMLERLEQPRA